MNIYRVTIVKRNPPRYGRNSPRTKYVPEKWLNLTLVSNSLDNIKVERALVGEFTDVTDEYRESS